MSRRSKPAKRVPLADPVYNSVDISKFINRIMRHNCVKRTIYYTPSLLFCQYFVMEAAK